MIEIVMMDGDRDEWGRDEFTDYRYDGKCFIIIKGEKYIGVYNMDAVRRIAIED